MRRAVGWLLILAGVVAVGGALVTMPVVTWWLLGCGLVAFAVGCAIEPLPTDLLADHPAEACPSCGGTGWAVVRAERITYAQGSCRCVGGSVWAA